MDPLSISAGIVGLLQATGLAITYLNDIKQAPKERAQCAIEATTLYSLLTQLRYRVEAANPDEPWFDSVRALAVPKGPFEQLKALIEELLAAIAPKSRADDLKKRLLWNLTKKEVSSILDRAGRLKSTIQLALEKDHFELSRAIEQKASKVDQSVTLLNDSIVEIRLHEADRDDEELAKNIRQWISPTDYHSNQLSEFLRVRLLGTCQWFLESKAFEDWVSSKSQMLLGHGMPGSGKTIIAATVIERLQTEYSTESTATAYLFCNYSMRHEQRLEQLLGAILEQLLRRIPTIPPRVKRLYEEGSRHGMRLRPEDLVTAIEDTVTSFDHVSIVVDALDELREDDGTRGRLLQTFGKLQNLGHVNILVTSRQIPHIIESISADSSIEILAHEEDIHLYVTKQILFLPGCVTRSNELQSQITRDVTGSTQGMFLLAKLHMDSLKDKITPRAVKRSLESLPKGSAALDVAYENVLKRIDQQEPGIRSIAEQCISWLVYSRRQMTWSELQHALAIEIGDSELDMDNIPLLEDVAASCAGMISIDPQSNGVRLVHYTAQEYLERTWEVQHPSSRTEVSSKCLSYLSLSFFESGPCIATTELQSRLQEFCLLEYTAKYWGYHVHHDAHADMPALIEKFLGNEKLLHSAYQIMQVASFDLGGHANISILCDTDYPTRISAIHMAAYFDLQSVVARLLELGYAPDVKDSEGRTPLSWTAELGRTGICERLLQLPQVDPDSIDTWGRSPLHYASKSGHTDIVRALVQTGKVQVNRQSTTSSADDKTALTMAVERGHIEIVRILLSTAGSTTMSNHRPDMMALSAALSRGDKQMTDMLLPQLHVDLDELFFWLHIHSVVSEEDDANKNAQMLTEIMSTEDAPIDQQHRVLTLAVQYGQTNVVKSLLARSYIDPNTTDIHGRTPLSHLAENVVCLPTGNQGEMLQLLLQSPKIKVNTADWRFRTPLSYAAEHRQLTVLGELLCWPGIAVNAQDCFGRTPISYAAASLKFWHSTTVRGSRDRLTEEAQEKSLLLLLAHQQTSVLVPDLNSETPLMHAERTGALRGAEILKEKEAEQQISIASDSMQSSTKIADENYLTRVILPISDNDEALYENVTHLAAEAIRDHYRKRRRQRRSGQSISASESQVLQVTNELEKGMKE